MAQAKIYKPSAKVTQSGEAKDYWLLRFVSDDKKYIDPMMGWVGSKDTKRQLFLQFATQEDAENYAKKNGIDFSVEIPKGRKIKPKSYAQNFQQ